MKKLFLLCAIVLCSVLSYSNVITIQPGLTLEQTFNKYTIHFTMPDYEIVEEVISDNINDHIFSKLQPYHDYFDHLDEDGRPTLPFYTLHLAVPMNATWSVTDVQTTTETITLDYDYIPAQTHFHFSNMLSYDVAYYSYYNNQWRWDDYEEHETGYGPNRGIAFSFFPCHYEPSARELTIVTEATYEITCSNCVLGSFLSEFELANSLSTLGIYDNFYYYNTETTPESITKNRYLIVTPDYWMYDEALEDFIYHKSGLGYNVVVEGLSSGDCYPEQIRSIIKEHYDNEGVDFVLLVGDVSELPFSSGIQCDRFNPPTDIYYACLDSNTIATQGTDLSPDVYIGRWPINSSTQLEAIVAKTMHSDSCLGMNYPDRIAIFTGSDRGADFFYEDGAYIYNNVVCGTNHPYTGALYDGRNLNVDSYTMINELTGLNEDPTWLFIYTGHGIETYIGPPYTTITSSYLSDDHMSTATLPYQSFAFMFACLIGNIYESDNFAREWIGIPDGGVTMWASTTNSTYNPDRNLSRIIFNQLKRPYPVTIGEFVANGTAKYYNANLDDERFGEAKRYVLYGDPSLYLFGLILSVEQQVHGRDNLNKLHIENGLRIDDGVLMVDLETVDDFQSIQLYSISGQLLFKSTTGQINLRGLSCGMYLAVINDANGKMSQTVIINR